MAERSLLLLSSNKNWNLCAILRRDWIPNLYTFHVFVLRVYELGVFLEDIRLGIHKISWSIKL